jgi:hypothetical protein
MTKQTQRGSGAPFALSLRLSFSPCCWRHENYGESSAAIQPPYQEGAICDLTWIPGMSGALPVGRKGALDLSARS